MLSYVKLICRGRLTVSFAEYVTQEDMVAALRGAVVGLVWVGGLFAAGPLTGGFGLVPLADFVIVTSPGWFAATMIDLLGFWAKPLLLGSLVAGAALLAGGLGVVAARLSVVDDRLRSSVWVSSGVAVTCGLLALGGVPLSAPMITTALIAVFQAFLAGWILKSSSTDTTSLQSRRSFAGRSLAILGGATVSVGLFRATLDRIAGSRDSRTPDMLPVAVSPPTGDPGFEFGEMPPAIPSPTDHYVIHKNVSPPSIDASEWQLTVSGAVSDPYELAYDDLLGHEKTVQQSMTMVCVSNEVGGDLIGTAHWTGVPLSELVKTAAPADGTVDVVTHAADGYSETFPIEQIRREDILLAYGMGDRTLRDKNGFPARLLIPGRYGMKMTKWIDEIELVESDRDGYWHERGWNEEAVLNTGSYIQSVTRDGQTVQIGGVAFGGLETQFEEIQAVEVSIDGGDSWNQATLESQLGPHMRRRWKHPVDVEAGTELEIVCRTIRQDGSVQTADETDPRPGGATGWHRVSETV